MKYVRLTENVKTTKGEMVTGAVVKLSDAEADGLVRARVAKHHTPKAAELQAERKAAVEPPGGRPAPTRDELKAALDELGVEYAPRTPTAKLAELLEQARPDGD